MRVPFVKMHIESLGPIESGDLELGDITLLFGLPNTGKSYTLRALYASTILLDKVAWESEIQRIIDSQTMGPISLLSYLSNAQMAFYVLIVLNKLDFPFSVQDFSTIREIFLKMINAENIDWQITEGILTLTLRSSRIMPLDTLIESRMDEYWNVLPINLDTKIESSVKTPKMSEIIREGIKQTHPYEWTFYDETNNINYRFVISLELDSEGAIELTIETMLSIDLEGIALNRFISNKELAELKKVLSVDNYQTMIESIMKHLPLSSVFAYRTQPKIDGAIRHAIVDLIGESIYMAIWGAYSESYSLQAVRFIPFGRSLFINQLEYISQEPFQRFIFQNALYGSGILSSSYMSWLSKGRSTIADNSYDNKLLSLFLPVLQGKLVYDKLKGLIYTNNNYDIPIKWVSALAGEVTGILLPLLSTPSESRIIVEEPEAQLHYSAQLLIAMTLMAVAGKYNHEIIISTHSDLIVLLLAYLRKYQPNREKIEELVKKILELQNMQFEPKLFDPLVYYTSKAEDLNIRFYYYKLTEGGVEVSETSVDEIIKNIPSLTDLIDAFASWALSLGDSTHA